MLNEITHKTQMCEGHKTLKWTMSPIGLTVSCKSPPHIRACIDSGSPFRHGLTHIPAFGHIWIQGVNRCVLFLLEMILCQCVIKWCHSVNILTDLESAHQGLSFEVLHDIVPSIWKFDLGVHHFCPLVLTMKVISDRPSKLIS
jgi:hypothetical protein